MKVKVKKLTPTARLPEYATDGSGAFDLFADSVEYSEVQPTATIKTGLAFEIPQGSGMFILSRSGHGFKHDIRLANCVGLSDADYRGEVMVKLRCDDLYMQDFKQGDRIAQAVILPIPRIDFVEADELSETGRGAGGFGSTGN